MAPSEDAGPWVKGQGVMARGPGGVEARGRGVELKWQKWGLCRAPAEVRMHSQGGTLNEVGCALIGQKAPWGGERPWVEECRQYQDIGE